MAEMCPSPNPECRYFGTPECMVTTHHIYYPGFLYLTKVEKAFRENHLNKERLSRCDHDFEHLTNSPPEKPSRDFMIGFIISSGVHIPASLRKDIRNGEDT
jgi:hypothetical protein